MDFWRRAAGRSRRKRITNERVRETMGVLRNVVDEIKTKQLRWYGHVQRISEDRLPKQVLAWTPQGKRKRRRLRRSWRERIDREMQERDLEEDLWMNRDQ